MKKTIKNIFSILSAFISAVMMFSSLGILAYSETEDLGGSPFYNISCVYDPNQDCVEIEYRMKSDDVKKYSENDIFVYAVPVNATAEYIEANQLEPVTQALPPSNRYTVDLPISNLSERLSAYVLSVQTPSGPVYSEIISPGVEGYGIDSGFKGVDSLNMADTSAAFAQTAIVEINTDSLDGGSSGYLHTVGDKTYTFSSEYLSSVDIKVKNYLGSGCGVYLRLISKKDPASLLSHSYDDQRDIYAYLSFLCSRYQEKEFGGVSGIILGDSFCTSSPEHARGYAASMYAAAVAVEGHKIGLILPLSGTETQMKAFLTELGSLSLDHELPTVTVMTESDRAPYGLNKDVTDRVDAGEEGDEKIDRDFNKGYVSAETARSFESYIRSLSSRTGCVFPKTVYHWTPDAKLGKNAVIAAYVYNYYKLYFETSTEAYIVSLDSLRDDGEILKALVETIEYIDSNLRDERVDEKKICEYFGFLSLASEIEGFSGDGTVSTEINRKKLASIRPEEITGVYNYFDFSLASGLSGWYEGSGCNGISSGKTEFGKGLTARLSANGNMDYIVYNYEYSESFKYTDTVSIDISLDSGADKQSLDNSAEKFTVYVILGGKDFRYEYSAYGFKAGEKYTVFADVEELNEEAEVEYIRIGAVPDSVSSEEYRLNVYSINAESRVYNDRELADLIESERERLKSDEAPAWFTPGAIAFVAVVCVLTAFIMIMVSREKNQARANAKDKQI